MVYPVLQREPTVHLNNGHWYLCPIDENDRAILGPVDYGWERYSLYPDSFTFGEGLLAGSRIPGTRRLVFCAWSQLLRLQHGRRGPITSRRGRRASSIHIRAKRRGSQ